MNTVGYFRFLMQRSCAVRVILWTAVVTFGLSMAFTAADIVLGCEYSVLFKPCSYLTPDNPFECSTQAQTFCCRKNNVDQCDTEPLQCVLKPENGIDICFAMLITSWALYLIFIGSFVLAIVHYRRVGPQIADDYVRMTKVTEISHSSSQVSDHQNIQNIGIPNYML